MQTVYSKAADEYPIKNGQLISCMRIDKRNNIYLAVGGDLNIYSLRRLGATKDYLECIIHIADLIKERNEPTDVITESFGLPSCSQSIASLIDPVTKDNKLMNSKNLAARATYLNSKNPHICSLSLSQLYSPEAPSICLTLNDRTMMLLKHTKDGYQRQTNQTFELKNIRLAQYLWENVLAVLTHRQLMVVPDSMNKALLDSVIHDGVLAIEGCQTGKGSYLFVLLYPEELFIANVSPANKITQQTIHLPVLCDYLHFHNNVITVGSSTSLYRFQVGNKEINQSIEFPKQKLLMVEGERIFSSENISQQHLVRAMGYTTNRLLVLIGTVIGASHKECDLIVQSPDCFDLLRNCLLQLAQFDEGPLWPVNFHDLRLLRNKTILSELIDTVLVLHDSSVVEGVKNPKERKINAALCQSASIIVEQLRLRNSKLLVTKLLINLLIIVRKEQSTLLEKLILEEIHENFKKKGMSVPLLEPGQVFKRCANTLQRLGNSPVLKCMQCKLFRINTSPEQFEEASIKERICFVCWGQIQPVRAK